MTDVDLYAKRLWEYHHMHQPLRHCEAIFVPCSTDLSTCRRAIELYERQFGNYIIFSGGRGRLSARLYDTSEAELFGGMALAAGIPAEKIILEEQASNTGENIAFTYKLLTEKGLSPRSLLVVQKPYMERRLLATIRKVWPDKQTSFVITSPDITFEAYVEQQSKDHVINMLVGDLQRLIEYPKLGFMEAQHIPDDVQEAYERLVAAGFTKQLIKEQASDEI